MIFRLIILSILPPFFYRKYCLKKQTARYSLAFHICIVTMLLLVIFFRAEPLSFRKLYHFFFKIQRLSNILFDY